MISSDQPNPSSGSAANKAERAWIGAVVGYSVLRFVLAWGAMGDSGVNPWIFGLIDVGTAWPYAKATAGVVRSGWDRRLGPLAGWAVVAVTTFFAPYAYLWIAGDEATSGVRLGLILIVLTLFVGAGLGILRKISNGRAS